MPGLAEGARSDSGDTMRFVGEWWRRGRRQTADASERPDPRHDKIVLLATVANEPLAQLYKQILSEEGIKAMAKPVGPGFGGWGSVATLQHDIYVLSADKERAEAVLADLDYGGGVVLPGEG